MTNISAIKSLCNAIANTFFPDEQTIELVLFNEGIEPTEAAKPKDARIFRIAAHLVIGYVEGSRSEGGVSISVRDEQAIKNSLAVWCKEYGLDVETELSGYIRSIKDCTDYW